jgi:hypothetical protein
MFRVPEANRVSACSSGADGCNGAFWLESPEPGWRLFVIASDGGGWEHVSTHARTLAGRERTPTWKEMAYVKGIFWEGEDLVIQYHPRASEYVNRHPHVLHQWRPVGVPLPSPPPEFVG